uniref:Uncharacterized protein n=1 Tax=Haptolina brevifila TaxID=156173 RepID=A0A7S2NHV0_9EUKA|mmetsp:Transcript_79142/g.157337  ORF Transcript_79142/g.157337 Transcript_79142/m.157337 type:complete len:420 (+) Transcript_79142:167-1426(+)|eukprot:CAMPEP_0174718256 /NCGR_PEP_ID=MMETSP1094-20130205/28401_1 /TAXON_ID=156173 /ORGANISM="Chrysochromulina brevifilum, Strain UTEX LB 985" /LENGTH=419 /DNA_ID=CAMNT_0015918313 /DNA_START=167 /DNA_END=1426 /DNA_ORIENTATION=-
MKKESSPLLTDDEVTTPANLFGTLQPCYKCSVLALLLTSFWLNITCLIPSIHFVTINISPKFLESAPAIGIWMGSYSIFHTIDVLIDHGCIFLAVLLVGWSIIFPIAKVIWVSVLLMCPPATARCWCCGCSQLTWLGQLGRWSLLDILILLLLVMVMLDEDDLISIGPISFGITASFSACPGVYLFTTAILCSITAIGIVELQASPIRFQKRVASLAQGVEGGGAGEVPPNQPMLYRAPSILTYPAALCAVFGMGSTILSFFLKLFTVNELTLLHNLGNTTSLGVLSDTLLQKHAWSLASGLIAIVRTMDIGMVFIAICFVLLALAVPIALHLTLLLVLLNPSSGVPHGSMRLASFFSTLCLSEVLFAAMVLYMFQISDKLISIILGPGFVALTVQMVTMPTSIVLCHLACRAVETNDS